MKKILAIGASNSSKSINKTLATYIANQLENVTVEVLDWNAVELPIYNPDLEAKSGIPENAKYFKNLVASADAIVLSLAEHNGLQTAAFKNLWDWTSRIEQKMWANKPMFLAATSPGARGGQGVLSVTKSIMPYFGGNIQAEFSLASFYENFKENDITDEALKNDLNEKIKTFQANL